MNRNRTLNAFAALTCLSLLAAQASAADAASVAKPAPPALVLVPEPKPPAMPVPPVAPKAPVMPSMPSMPATASPAAPSLARTAPAEVLPQLPSGRSHTVAARETLDRVIQKTMADSPLKVELIRQAFVQLNPHAFPDGRVVRLKVGTVLQVPDSAQLLRQVLLPVLENAEAAAVARSGMPQAADDKRRWVRFP